MIDREDITAIILCGGRGSRLDGLDKPLIDIGGKRIVDCMIDCLSTQVGAMIVSCSRNVALYEALGHKVVVDSDPGRGPLAGLYECFSHVETEWAFTTPGDVPFIPESVVARLQQDALENGIAVPTIDGQRQNLCLLLNKTNRDELCEFYVRGGGAVKHWLNDHGKSATDLSDLAPGFFNVNTSEELAQAKSKLKSIEH
ncbi:MAG: molybdenum cofactor guanylyltransferase [Gammaproteobacteria bacterium]|nr:molybdenum cofactor guanylyltransferase [Gammaproteobacteria bacterium]